MTLQRNIRVQRPVTRQVVIVHNIRQDTRVASERCLKKSPGLQVDRVLIGEPIDTAMQIYALSDFIRKFIQITAADKVAAELPYDQLLVLLSKHSMGQEIHGWKSGLHVGVIMQVSREYRHINVISA